MPWARLGSAVLDVAGLRRLVLAYALLCGAEAGLCCAMLCFYLLTYECVTASK